MRMFSARHRKRKGNGRELAVVVPIHYRMHMGQEQLRRVAHGAKIQAPVWKFTRFICVFGLALFELLFLKGIRCDRSKVTTVIVTDLLGFPLRIELTIETSGKGIKPFETRTELPTENL